MLLKMYTIYDSKAEMYLPPFYTKTLGLALRFFTDSCRDPDHPFHKYPEDFTLFQLGTFDDTSATFTLEESAIALGKALQFIPAEPIDGLAAVTAKNGDDTSHV